MEDDARAEIARRLSARMEWGMEDLPRGRKFMEKKDENRVGMTHFGDPRLCQPLAKQRLKIGMMK